ncbi:MAG: ABC transporter ATPase [Saprospiraceae bacterium]|nr:ABC transporter ATPase [Saprospiraceae bacterium]
MLKPIVELANDSKVWIYQSDSLLTDDQTAAINQDLFTFLSEWSSHNQQLHAAGNVFFNRFVVLMADESYVTTGGCSIDKSIHFIQYLETRYKITLLERLNVAYCTENTPNNQNISIVSLSGLQALYLSGDISDDTLVFDNLVKTKSDFESAWIKPISQSWHKRFV